MAQHLILTEVGELALEIEGDSHEVGAKVISLNRPTDPPKKSQQWRMVAVDDEANSDGRCFVISAHDRNLVLDVEAGCPEPGTRLIVWEKKLPPEDNQLFVWDEGVLKCCLDPSLVVTAVEGAQGAVSVQYNQSLPGQRWKIV